MISNLSDRDRRTIRLASIGIGIYLALFFGFRVWNAIDKSRRDYLRLHREATIARLGLEPYQDKVIALKRLMDEFRMDPGTLSNATVVAETSAAVQRAAVSQGLMLGPLRESPPRGSNKELAQLQLEGSGPVPAVLAFLSNLETLGFPVTIDTLQIASDKTRPGNVKVTLSLVILNFEQWKKGRPNA